MINVGSPATHIGKSQKSCLISPLKINKIEQILCSQSLQIRARKNVTIVAMGKEVDYVFINVNKPTMMNSPEKS